MLLGLFIYLFSKFVEIIYNPIMWLSVEASIKNIKILLLFRPREERTLRKQSCSNLLDQDLNSLCDFVQSLLTCKQKFIKFNFI